MLGPLWPRRTLTPPLPSPPSPARLRRLVPTALGELTKVATEIWATAAARGRGAGSEEGGEEAEQRGGGRRRSGRPTSSGWQQDASSEPWQCGFGRRAG
uniref:Uncharacterized protein n=1 Tax=Arundo donax TaxID=35708 RepID=A0A0A9DEZ4_ARUDO